MAEYNDYKTMPYIPYNIIRYLAENNDNIWKILKYNDYNCLNKPNLSLEEKISMIWTKGEQENKNIFLTSLVEDMIIDSTTILQLYKSVTDPINHIEGVSVYTFEILYGGKISMINYNGIPCNRGDVIEHELLHSLNGIEVGGVGTFQFNSEISSFSKSLNNIGNNKTFTGTSLMMSVYTTGIREDKKCC